MPTPTIHPILDTDEKFIIDPISRKIENESGKITLIQYDHNSERYGFTIPRYVEGHDMSLSTSVEVHYNNVASAGGRTNHGLYEVTDMQVNPDNEQEVIFTWLVSNNATQLVGSLNFVIRFSCFADEYLVYAWHTGIYNAIVIAPGIYNSDIIVEEYPDVLRQWEIEFGKAYTDIPDGTDILTLVEDGWYRGVGSQLVNSPTVESFAMRVTHTSEDVVTRLVFPSILPSPMDSIDPYIYVGQQSISEGHRLQWARIEDDKIELHGTELRLGSATIPGAPYYAVNLAPITTKSLNLNESTLELQRPDGTVESSVDLSSLGGGSGSSSSGITTYTSDVALTGPVSGYLRCRYMVVGSLVVLTYTFDGAYALSEINKDNWNSNDGMVRFQEDTDVLNAIDNLVGNGDSIIVCGYLQNVNGTVSYPCRIQRYWRGPHYLRFPIGGSDAISVGSNFYGTLTAVVPIAQ